MRLVGRLGSQGSLGSWGALAPQQRRQSPGISTPTPGLLLVSLVLLVCSNYQLPITKKPSVPVEGKNVKFMFQAAGNLVEPKASWVAWITVERVAEQLKQ